MNKKWLTPLSVFTTLIVTILIGINFLPMLITTGVMGLVLSLISMILIYVFYRLIRFLLTMIISE